MANTRIIATIETKVGRELRARAKLTGRKPADLIREAVESYLGLSNGSESAHEMALRLGLVGKIRGTAPDLSSNSAHMEGFGQL